MIRVGRSTGLAIAVLFVLMLAACNGPEAVDAPTEAPATQAGLPATPTDSAPASTATAAPTEAPSATAEPQAGASPTGARETVSFDWAPGSVPPSDADDVADLFNHLRAHEGIHGGTGDESGIDVIYDPTVLTVAEIMDILDGLGHPVIER